MAYLPLCMALFLMNICIIFPITQHHAHAMGIETNFTEFSHHYAHIRLETEFMKFSHQLRSTLALAATAKNITDYHLRERLSETTQFEQSGKGE